MSDEIASTLARMEGKLDQAKEAHGIVPEWLSIVQASAYSSLSTDSVRKLIDKGQLTAYRPLNGRVLVNRREFDDRIRASTSVPRKRRGIRK